MKRNYFIGIMVLCIVLLVGALSYFPIAQTTLTWEGILPHIYTGADGDYAINVAYTASTTGWDVSEETATTNALVEVESVTLTTSGTPAANLGPKKTWTVETSASHNEDIGYIGFSIADGTLDSENGDFEIGNMADGAAAATKWTLGSTGIATMVGGATWDNTTSATDLNITETTITLTASGGVTTSAALTATTDITATDDMTVGGWLTIPSTTVAAQSYTISSTGKASAYIVDYTDTGAATIFLPDTPADGTIIWVKDGDLNGASNNLVVGTEGSDTIDEGATYTMNADGESVMFLYDSGGTDWNVMTAYGE